MFVYENRMPEKIQGTEKLNQSGHRHPELIHSEDAHTCIKVMTYQHKEVHMLCVNRKKNGSIDAWKEV